MRILLNLFKPKSSFKPTRKSFVWRLFDAYTEQIAMRGYVKEYFDCHARHAAPSKKILHRYGLTFESSNLAAWAILEMYVKGELVKKEIKQAPKEIRDHFTNKVCSPPHK